MEPTSPFPRCLCYTRLSNKYCTLHTKYNIHEWSSTKLGGGGVTNILIDNGSGEWLQEWWVVRGAADNAIGGWTKLPHWDSSHEISLTTSTVFTLLPSLTSKTVLAGNVFVRVAIFKSNQEVKQCTPHLLRLSDRQEVILTLQLYIQGISQ